MEIRIGDRFTDQEFEWEVVTHRQCSTVERVSAPGSALGLPDEPLRNHREGADQKSRLKRRLGLRISLGSGWRRRLGARRSTRPRQAVTHAV
jgi:hypothetical protein